MLKLYFRNVCYTTPMKDFWAVEDSRTTPRMTVIPPMDTTTSSTATRNVYHKWQCCIGLLYTTTDRCCHLECTSAATCYGVVCTDEDLMIQRPWKIETARSKNRLMGLTDKWICTFMITKDCIGGSGDHASCASMTISAQVLSHQTLLCQSFVIINL